MIWVDKMRLTLEQFKRAIEDLNLEPQTVDITEEVLVQGQRQVDVAKKKGLTKGTVSQAVRKVIASHEMKIMGGVLVTAILPEHQAFIVRQWADQFKSRNQKCKP